ncbi:hypothetical protein [Bacillus infantis]|uniref:hypothetical protein n=1 Tax=Bacillus infantis TaxID=324767 RepID=UPI0020A1DEB3|nr:hypothetical protein [Bacillus infantis]MCP1159281.1 hypothetical protein [Bacillus infantis]
MVDFENDQFTKLIMGYHDIGLQLNEMKKTQKTVPIEWYENLLESVIFMASEWRNESDRHDQYVYEMKKALGM